MDIYNFSQSSTWFAISATGKKATSEMGVSTTRGLQTRLVQHARVALKIYDYWSFEYTGGAGTLIVFLNDNVNLVLQSGFTSTLTLSVIPYTANVKVSVKDALSGQGLSGVTVKEDGQVLGTIDDGQSLELTKGTHTLTLSKDGYWSVTKTIDVQSDMGVSVEMYPSSAAFKLENFPANISIPEHTIYELTFTLSPIDTSATYNIYHLYPHFHL